MTKTKILLDTNFFMYLLSPTMAGWHERAKLYWKYFLENGHELYLSSIVAAELSARVDLSALPLMKHLIALPFNFTDAMTVGQMMRHLQSIGQDVPILEVSKVQLKDDVKILAQAIQLQSQYLVSGDQQILNRFHLLSKHFGGSGSGIDLAQDPSAYFHQSS
jgi:predicted nucleic acid-binding protein